MLLVYPMFVDVRFTSRQKLCPSPFMGYIYLNLVSLDLVNPCEFTHFRNLGRQLMSQNTTYFKHVKGKPLSISLQTLDDACKIDA